jgi:MFS family permease
MADTLLFVVGFMLGFVEAAFFPGAFYYLSMFYNRRQIAFRTAILYSGSQLGNAFGTLLAIAITKLDGVHGIAGWRWYIPLPFLLPNLPADNQGLGYF